MENETDFDIEKFKKSYSGLRKAPLEVWIAEFLKRDEQFQEDCKQLDKATKAIKKISPPEIKKAAGWNVIIALQQQYGVGFTNWQPEKWATGKPLLTHPSPPLRAVRVFASDTGEDERSRTKAIEIKLKRKDCVATDFEKHRTWAHLETASGRKKQVPRRPAEMALYDLLGTHGDRGKPLEKDSLLLAIDLRRTEEEIIDHVRELLKIHLLPKTNRRVPKKWLNYLMVYDLAETHEKTYKEIANLLAPSFEAGSDDETNFSHVRNIKNYYDKAKKLIEGQYREFLF